MDVGPIFKKLEVRFYQLVIGGVLSLPKLKMFYSNLNNIRMCVSIMTIISIFFVIMTTMMMAVEYVNRVPASRIISNLDGRR